MGSFGDPTRYPDGLECKTKDELLSEYNSAVIDLSRTVQARADHAGTAKAGDFRFVSDERIALRQECGRHGRHPSSTSRSIAARARRHHFNPHRSRTGIVGVHQIIRPYV